jgi:hypothetical protein
VKVVETPGRSVLARAACFVPGGRSGRLAEWYRRRREQRVHRQEFRAFRDRYGALLSASAATVPMADRRVLFLRPRAPNVEVGIALMKGLQWSGAEPIIVDKSASSLPRFRPYYCLAGIREIYSWEDFSQRLPIAKYRDLSTALLSECRSIDDVLALIWNDVRVGLFAASTALRKQYLGDLNLETTKGREAFRPFLIDSLQAAESGAIILKELRPDTIVLLASEYTPEGEMFDLCLKAGVQTIGMEPAHRNSALVFKRYRTDNRNDHVWSLSEKTWTLVRKMAWTPAHEDAVRQEIEGGYLRADWYGLSRTQFHTALLDPEEVRRLLRLRSGRKTVFVFPPILWDAPFSWSRSTVFSSYQEWFLETVKAAVANDAVDWVIKIHPANLGKQAMEHYEGGPVELDVLAGNFATLPAHVTVVPPDSPISTYSLFGLMDGCLTVRGTVGIEAATFGVPVVTAASSRYSGKGFTIDSSSRTEYLQRLARIQDLPRLTSAQRELARRFAYGLFVLRPLTFHSITWGYGIPDGLGGIRPGELVCPHVKTAEAWKGAADFTALSTWIRESAEEDFLSGIAEAASEERCG